MNLFQKGYQQLANDLTKECGVNVSIYRNGELFKTLKVVFSVGNYENFGKDGKNIFSETIEVLFNKNDDYIPVVNDVIVISDNIKYEIRPAKFRQKYNFEGGDIFHLDDEQGFIINAHAQKIS